MRYRRLQILVFAALLAALTAIHCIPTEAQADRRRRPWTTYVSASDRLVVECDMRSDTCSDGRKISTTRATPVPCEVSPGVWEMVPEDTGCYSVRGLESWAATTSYLSYGAELDRSPWQAVDGATVQSLPTGGYRVIGTGSNARIMQPGIPAVPGPHTLSCIARSVDETPQARMRIYWDASSPASVAIPVTTEWAVHSISATVPEEWEGNISIHVYSRTGTVDVIGCWLAHTSTPGRPCWGGEAPVTCEGERNSISTDGWPTKSGEISVTFRAGPPTSGDNAIIEARDGGTILFSLRRRASNGMIRLITSGPTLDGASVDVGDTAHVRVVRDGSTVSLWVNGVKSDESGGMPAWVWSSTATLGRNPAGPSLPLNGSIRSLTVRSFE